jgi:DNA-binding HxlR family transcriptional regulator
VARGAEIFAERWTPLIVRELLCGPRRFTQLLQGLPNIPRALLTQRLISLELQGVLERQVCASGRGHSYQLTTAGEELRPVIEALGSWAYKTVVADLREEHLDPTLLMWFLSRRVIIENLPGHRVVLFIHFRREPRHQYWLVLERPEVDLCLIDPGFEVNITLDADLKALTQVYLGHLDLSAAMSQGSIELTGPAEEQRLLPSWLGISPFAPAGRLRTTKLIN